MTCEEETMLSAHHISYIYIARALAWIFATYDFNERDAAVSPPNNIYIFATILDIRNSIVGLQDRLPINLIPPKPLTRCLVITTQAEASSIQSKSTQANAPHYIVYYKVQLTHCRPARQAGFWCYRTCRYWDIVQLHLWLIIHSRGYRSNTPWVLSCEQ
jgi:hypothetical protein